MTPVGRLAPTPSGRLHLGNVCAFTAAWLSIRQQGGRLLLRIEDVDVGRARADVADGVRRDLDWLGLGWDEEVPAQSTRDYTPWLARLPTYRCVCTRAQVGGAAYAGTCRSAGHVDGAVRFVLPRGSLTFVDRRCGLRTVDPGGFGDPVLRRRDGTFTYNLAVVADDLVDGVTEVVRGADLLDFTGVQIRLWEAFDATPPTYLHAPVVLGADARKLSKSHDAVAVEDLRAAGASAASVRALALAWLGLVGDDLDAAARAFRPQAGPRGPIRLLDSPSCSGDALRVSWVDGGR